MPTLISKIIDVFLNPLNTFFVIGLFLTSLVFFSFNFFPEKILKRIKMTEFLNQYTYIVIIVMLLTFFLLVIQLGMAWYKKRENKKFGEFLQREQDKLFEDRDAKLFLNQLYENHPQSVPLPKNNQKVKLLLQYQLIHQASSIQLVTAYGANDPYFPYILQPGAEEKMKEMHGVKSSQ